MIDGIKQHKWSVKFIWENALNPKPKSKSAPQEKGPTHRRRKDARPGEIIEAGLLEFAESGYAATRLEDVAKRAGVVKGTIYRYFEDKEALFLAAARSRITPTFEGFGSLVDGYQGSTRELLKVVFATIHNKLVHGDMYIIFRIILSEGRNFPQLPALYYREGISNGQKLLKRIIERGIERGEVRRGAATELPVVIVAPALMAAMWKMLFNEQQPIPKDQFVDAHIDLVLDGILKTP